MKNTTELLSNHLRQAKNFICFDLYELVLANGVVYGYTDGDKNIIYGNRTYKSAMPITRQQVKLNDRVVVDTMTITLNPTSEDKLGTKTIMQAAHDGTLDRARLYLRRCFFDDQQNILGVIDLFGGNVEVNKCGGMLLELTVKAKTQGLSQEFPIRHYYPQGTFNTVGGIITSSTDDDSATLIAPYVPLKEVLL